MPIKSFGKVTVHAGGVLVENFVYECEDFVYEGGPKVALVIEALDWAITTLQGIREETIRLRDNKTDHDHSWQFAADDSDDEKSTYICTQCQSKMTLPIKKA